MSKMSRILITLFVGIFIFAVGLFYISTTIIESVTVSGNHHNSRDEILDLTGYGDKSTLLDVILNRRVRIEDDGYIDVITIDKVNLKNIRINVVEKEIIGYIEYMGKYICLDNRGYIVDYTEVTDEGKPLVKGIDLSSFTKGQPLDVTDDIIGAINAIYQNAKTFQVPIQWIDFKYGEGDDISVLTDKLDIRIGNIDRIEEKFQLIQEVMAVLPEDRQGILHIENVDDDIILEGLDTTE